MSEVRTGGLLSCLLVTGLVAAGLALTGCGAEGGGKQPVQSAIPRVPNPKDVTAVADRPCALLPPPQAAGFGLDRPPRQISGRLGTADCEWRSSRMDVWVYLSLATDRLTLEEVSTRRESLPYFELTEIGGHPAIASRTDAKLPACDIDIKTAERQSVTVSYDSTAFNNDLAQGCVVARQVAAAVLRNLPPRT
ncbi:MAG TPA: DUF3558 domain-containing protein [Pseudonocardiaceae bacterium]|jgi:hypothetical protein|nr:DUF3558 domain-containing protein [Pseudonocardiaceae bacterium]